MNYLKNILIFKDLVIRPKYLYQTNDKEKIDELVNVINSVINSQISEEERIIENSDKIVKIVKKNY